MVKSGYFKSGNNRLFYVYTVPKDQTKKTGIIFVHAAEGCRLGPHRMFVELARKFNSLGYPTLRFDLSGCGDSTANILKKDVRADISDIVAATDFLISNTNLDNIILFGISRGARVSFSALAQHELPIAAAILLSTPTSTTKAAVKSLSTSLKEYIYKLTDPSSLWRLLTGKANITQIAKTLSHSYQLKQRYKPIEAGVFASKCPVLFIYGENDPIATESCYYYKEKCRENDLPSHCHIIKGANHSFFHYKWKEQIFNISKEWLQKISKLSAR